MSSGYVIASVTVTNPEQYEEYKKWSTLAMQAHGAEVCIRGGKVEVLEGDWNPGRTVLLKFPSFEAARAPIVSGAASFRVTRTLSAASSRASTSRCWPGFKSCCSRKRRNAASWSATRVTVSGTPTGHVIRLWRSR